MRSISTCSPQQAAQFVPSNSRVYVGSNCAHPQTLTDALYARREELENVEVVHLLLAGRTPYAATHCHHQIRHKAFFLASNTREGFASGACDYYPMFLSEIPRAIRSGIVGVDVAMVAITRPDSQGWVNLGVSVDLAPAALESASIRLAQIQPDMPRTNSPHRYNIRDFHAVVESDHEILEHHTEAPSELHRKIASHVAPLIRDGDCLQTGIGGIPEAILLDLSNHNDLGIHSEIISDAVGALTEQGTINNSCKAFHKGATVTTICLGTKSLFKPMHESSKYLVLASDEVNDPSIIASIDNFVAINGALQVDLTGQVVSDSIGHMMYSGVGGQVDFIRGASQSKGGRPIIVLPSTAKGGTISRIVCSLAPGSGVVTSRADVHWVATEFGITNLYGKSIRDRAAALIEIAHPEFRDVLRSQARNAGLLSELR